MFRWPDTWLQMDATVLDVYSLMHWTQALKKSIETALTNILYIHENVF